MPEDVKKTQTCPKETPRNKIAKKQLVLKNITYKYIIEQHTFLWLT